MHVVVVLVHSLDTQVSNHVNPHYRQPIFISIYSDSWVCSIDLLIYIRWVVCADKIKKNQELRDI